MGGGSAAWGDYDGDGWVRLSAGGRLSRNTGNDNHWLAVDVKGGGDINRAGFGATVRAILRKWTLTRHVGDSTGQANRNDPTAHFGLGAHGEPVAVEVRWPGGVTRRLTPPVDRRIVVVPPGAGVEE